MIEDFTDLVGCSAKWSAASIEIASTPHTEEEIEFFREYRCIPAGPENAPGSISRGGSENHPSSGAPREIARLHGYACRIRPNPVRRRKGGAL